MSDTLAKCRCGAGENTIGEHHALTCPLWLQAVQGGGDTEPQEPSVLERLRKVLRFARIDPAFTVEEIAAITDAIAEIEQKDEKLQELAQVILVSRDSIEELDATVNSLRTKMEARAERIIKRCGAPTAFGWPCENWPPRGQDRCRHHNATGEAPAASPEPDGYEVTVRENGKRVSKLVYEVEHVEPLKGKAEILSVVPLYAEPTPSSEANCDCDYEKSREEVLSEAAEMLGNLDFEVCALRETLADVTDELEAEIEHRYARTKDHPAMKGRYDRDMESVVAARTALDQAKGDETTGKILP